MSFKKLFIWDKFSKKPKKLMTCTKLEKMKIKIKDL